MLTLIVLTVSEIAYGNRMGFLIGGTDVNGYRRALHVSLLKKIEGGGVEMCPELEFAVAIHTSLAAFSLVETHKRSKHGTNKSVGYATIGVCGVHCHYGAPHWPELRYEIQMAKPISLAFAQGQAWLRAYDWGKLYLPLFFPSLPLFALPLPPPSFLYLFVPSFYYPSLLLISHLIP